MVTVTTWVDKEWKDKAKQDTKKKKFKFYCNQVTLSVLKSTEREYQLIINWGIWAEKIIGLFHQIQIFLGGARAILALSTSEDAIDRKLTLCYQWP